MAAMSRQETFGSDTSDLLGELVGESLRIILPVSVAATWVWSVIALLTRYPNPLAYMALLANVGTVAISYQLCERHLGLAVGAYLCGLMIEVTAIALNSQGASALYLYVPVVIVTATLTKPRTMWLVALACVVLLVLVGTDGRIADLSEVAYPTLFVFLAAMSSWVSSRRLFTALAWSLNMTEQALRSASEAQERRGELYGVVHALEEATYRIERMNNEITIARSEAEEARALKAQFATVVSHELRGPLNYLLGFSRLMALSPESYGEPLPRAYRSDVYTIYRATQHLVALVDDVLDLSQIEAQRLPLIKDRIDLGMDVIEKTIEIVRPLAERKGLYLHQKLSGDLPWLLADPVRLRQALLNLLTNAVRFTERGGITVSTAQVGDRLLVSVRDTGSGIAAVDLPKLFKEFHQLKRSGEEKEKGSGLGLSISKHLIELHGGAIWVESAEGVGTTFHFTLPLPGIEVATYDVLERTEVLYHTLTPVCLIVHDDLAVVRLLARYLEGYRVIGSPDDQEVPGLVETLHPRAIVTTPELAGQIEKQLSGVPYDVPIISCAIPSMGEQAHLESILAYLVKPLMPQALAAVMSRVERNGETKVLIVDDEPDAVRLLERMLTSLPHPYKILKAYSGRQALELAQQQVPDVAFI